MVIHVGDETRTTNNGTSTRWVEGDELTVIHSAPGGSDFLASRFTKNPGENSFTGKVKRLSATNDWYVVYPYREENVEANQLSFTFPANQTQAGNASMAHLAGDHFPLVAKSLNLVRGNQLSVTMQNVLHVLEFDFENKTESANPVVVKEVQFTATSAIAGSFNVDLTGDNPVVTAGSGATKVVTLGVSNGASISANGTSTFYMAIAPFTAPAGSVLKIKVTATDTVTNSTVIFYRSITVGADGRTFSPGTIQQIGVEFDENHSQNPDAGSGTEVELPVGGEPEDGVYLLVYENGANSYAFAAFDEYKSQHYAIPVVVENGVVLPQDGIDLARFAVKLENTGEEHPNDAGHDAYNVRNSEGKYVFYATAGGTYEAADALHILDSNQMEVQGTLYHYYHTFAQTTDGVRIVCSIENGSGNKYLLSYTATDGFNYQQDNASGTNLHLFLLGEGSAKERQEPYFEPNTVDYNFDTLGEGTLANKPTLKDARTNVTSWESSSPAVASVDASGNVTVHQVGSAIITATLESDETYYGATASYTINVTSATVQTWYKADEMVAGQTYLIVSNGYALQNNSGSLAATAVSVSNDIITLNAPSGILWTATDGNGLKNNNQYLGSSSSTWSASLSIGSNATAWTYNADSNTITFSSSSTWGGATTYYLYYSTSSNAYTVNNSSSDTHVAALYSTTKPLTKQNISFAESTVIKIWGVDCSEGSTFPVQTVSNAQTSVTYESSDTNVATINGTTITIKGKGLTTITATAKQENGFQSATATYTLRINNPAPAGFTSLGTFNLENSHVSDYLDAAATAYTDENYHRNNGNVSIVATHTQNESAENRWDIPEPVKLTWTNASTGTTTITVYNDQALSDKVWTWTTNTSNLKSYEVYNLIPGRTYYCTVVDGSGDYLLKGTFDTEGRRRMIKVSDHTGADYANNCRDLGGIITADGTKRIRYGMIYRGTNLTLTSKDEQKFMVEFMNIGLDNDLRDGGDINNSSGSSSSRNNPFLKYYSVGFFPATLNGSYDVIYCGPGYGTGVGSTTGSALTNPLRLYQTMQAFIDCAKSGKASYFHCYIGSDRTGFWGFFLESLLGVSPKESSIDFELTGFAKHATGGNRERNNTGYTYYQGMDYFTGKDYYSDFANDPKHQLQKTVTKYLIDEVGQAVKKDDSSFDLDKWEADIETFKTLLLEDI